MKPYWENDEFGLSIYCGDCAEIIPKLNKKFNAIVTDPPYGVELINRVTKHTKRTATSVYDDDIDFVKQEIIPRVNLSLTYADCGIITPGIRALFYYPKPDDVGCVFFPNGAGLSKWGFGCFNPILFYGKDPYLSGGLGSRPNSVSATHWLSDDVDHPCPKPLKWMMWMVERATLVGQSVLDPFLGSGTLLSACYHTGRSGVGIEISEHYCNVAVDRIEKEMSQGRLFDPSETNNNKQGKLDI
jgi:DNA modification methylase